MAETTHPQPTLSNIMSAVQDAMASEFPPQSPSTVVYEGWLLKKKKRKMQGFARRYFILKNNGILSYSVHKGEDPRDQIYLSNAAFSSSPSNRSIHVDSGTATFHLRALTQDDYAEWLNALRTFITQPRPMSAMDGTLRQSVHYAHTVNFSVHHAAKMNALFDDMGKTLRDLHETSQTISDANTSIRSKHKDKEKDKDAAKEGNAGFLGLFAHKSKSPRPSESSPPDLKHKLSTSNLSTSHSHETEKPTIAAIISGLNQLQDQHAQLLSTFNSLLHLDTVTSPIRSPGTVLSPTGMGDGWLPTRALSRAGSRATRRAMSVGSSEEGDVEWFDADDALEEFVMEEPDAEAEVEAIVNDESDEDHYGSKYQTPPPTLEAPPNLSRATTEEVLEEPKPVKTLIRRRTHLPSPIVGDELSLLGILRKNVGKDLSQIALPVSFNEPISMLQRLAEDLEYSYLLERAKVAKDGIERMTWIAAFAISGYACTRLRAARKPFMPMLGETYEYDHTYTAEEASLLGIGDTGVETKGWRFIAEKVCHVPPVMACHAGSLDGDWSYDSVTQAKQKFWGRSLEIIPMGTTTVRIGKDVYSWTKPSSFMRNIMAGTKYLEHVGLMTIMNTTTNEHAEIEFKEAGMWGSSNIVNASIYNSRGKAVTTMEGKWHESLAKVTGKNQLEVIWRARELPKDAAQYYGFTQFTTGLNELGDDLKDNKGEWRCPVTDSRFRPDQRALEEGRVDEADELKAKVEEMQRARRRAGKDVKSRWFIRDPNGQEETDWQWNGGYWEAREEGWGRQEKLW